MTNWSVYKALINVGPIKLASKSKFYLIIKHAQSAEHVIHDIIRNIPSTNPYNALFITQQNYKLSLSLHLT